MQTTYFMQHEDLSRTCVYGRDRMKRLRKRGAVAVARWEHSAWTEIVQGALRLLVDACDRQRVLGGMVDPSTVTVSRAALAAEDAHD